MVSNITSTNLSLQGVSNLIRGVSDNSSLFDSLAGQGADTSSQGLISALGGNATPQSIDTILNKQKVDSAKFAIYVEGVQRIGYIQDGRLQPSADWEKIVGYAMNKGLPVIPSIGSDGGLQAQLQAETDLARFNPNQQVQIIEALSQIEVMAQKIQANQTNDSWLKKLEGASNDVYLVANLVIQPQTTSPNNWEQSAVLMARNGQPQKISLDTKGDLQTIDQRFDPSLVNLPSSLRAELQAAISSVTDTIRDMGNGAVQHDDGSAFEQWELAAANFAASKIPYYLEIDTLTGVITAKENSPENITPKFLKEKPYPDIGDDTAGLKQAAQFILDKKAYYLDIDSTGQVVAKEINAQNLVKYNTAKDTSINSLGTGAILSLFA